MKRRRRREGCPVGALWEHQRLPGRGSASSAICAAPPRPVPHHTAPHRSIPHCTAPTPHYPAPNCTTLSPHCPAPPRTALLHTAPIRIALPHPVPPHTTLSCTTQLP